MLLLDINKLEAGDIILTRSNSEISELVRRLTKSEYSHAILYVGLSSCIDSDGYGVQSENIQRMLFEYESDAVVLRVNEEFRKYISGAIVFARQKIGTEYSVAEAKISLLKKQLSAKEPNRQFCTRFVAQAYENAGVKLVDNPNYCNPEELLDSEKLVKVKDTLKEASEKEIELANSESPLEKQRKIHNQIFTKSREITGEDIQTFEQLSKFIIENPEVDSDITNVVRESGYLTMWKTDVEKNPQHYDPKLLVEHYKSPEQIFNVAVYWATTEKETRSRFETTLETMRYGYSFHKQDFFKDQIELLEKLIDLSKQRERTALTVLKN